MKKSIHEEKKIDEINSELWRTRYTDPARVAAESELLILNAEKCGYRKGRAYARLNIAAASFLQSKNEPALENLSDALIWFSENPSETGYAKALYLKGNIHESFGDYEKALEYCFKSQKFAAETNDPETEAEVASQLGLIFTRLYDFPKAMEYCIEGLKIRERLNDVSAIASSLNRLGMLMRLKKNHDESLEYYFKSLDLRKKNNLESSIPWTLLGIASTYEELGNRKEALKFYEDGIAGGDPRCTLQCIMGIGRIYSLAGDSVKAEKSLLESLNMAQELKALTLVSDAYSALAKHYESDGQLEKALENYKSYQKTRESVQSEEAQSRFRNIEISYAIEKSEQEKEIYRLRHVELKSAFDIIDEKNKEITASINYAGTIQRAMLPAQSDIRGLAANSFVLDIPRDIVSGDFCWFTRIDKKLIIAAADCTDHGVPGAMMTMLGISFLEKIVNQMKVTNPGEILDELRREVIKSLHQTGKRDEAKNGMDISVCVVDKKLNSVKYSGAFNSIYIARNNEIIEYKADMMPVAYYEEEVKQFSTWDIMTVPGDIIYMFSDGYPDQFGGPARKKFKYGPFKSLLLEICMLPLKKQKQILEGEFYKWKGKNSQTDDVLIVGLKV